MNVDEIGVAEARRYLVTHHGLRRHGRYAATAEGVSALLDDLGCIQLDPLDRIGTSPELVAMARIPDLRRGELLDLIFRGGAFEHWAKERCILPGSIFPRLREFVADEPWFRLPPRFQAVPDADIDALCEEVAARGPIAANELTDRGTVDLGKLRTAWKPTNRVNSMALRILWTRCRLVVAGRAKRAKVFDIPERHICATAMATDDEPFLRWALRDRVEASGFLPMNAGPWWGTLPGVRTGALPAEMVAEGALCAVRVGDARAVYLAPGDWRERFDDSDHESDGKMRIIAPLDPLIWDRRLVQQLFGFEYLWEVYKPAAKRRWGYYVCPLLLGEDMVGRFEGRIDDGELVTVGLWKESDRWDNEAWNAAFGAHAARVAAL